MSTKSVRTASHAEKPAKRTSKKPEKTARSAAKSAKDVRAKKAAAVRTRQDAGAAVQAMSIEHFLRPMPLPPAAPRETLIFARSPHKYQVGETVYFTSPSFGRTATSGNYTVIKLLPFDGDDCQYRIKSSGEAFERVAKESQLERI